MPARVVTPQLVRLTGDYAPQNVAAFARALQKTIADNWELSRAWSGPLGANTQKYQVWKILNGFDIRRGWKTGKLGDTIKTIKCWSARKTNDGWQVTFTDAPLLAAVPYAVYYREMKVRGDIIMGVNASWVREAEPELGQPRQKQPRQARPPAQRVPGATAPQVGISVRFVKRLLGQEVRI